MSRTLKTFITNLGFFELAVAAPSMKAALEAWGMGHNAFQHGFAKQTDDLKIIAAATEQPGVVLKRAVGSSGEFKEHAELPKSLPIKMLPKVEAPKLKRRAPSKTKKPTKKANRADIVSFKKAYAKREKKKRAAEEARIAKERVVRQRATDGAEAALEAARDRHEKEVALIEREQEKVDWAARKERDWWEVERERLEAAVERAKGNR
jgi:colicin import membrane protein